MQNLKRGGDRYFIPVEAIATSTIGGRHTTNQDNQEIDTDSVLISVILLSLRSFVNKFAFRLFAVAATIASGSKNAVIFAESDRR